MTRCATMQSARHGGIAFLCVLAYLPLDFVLVHDKLPEPSPVPARVRVVQVPHGLY